MEGGRGRIAEVMYLLQEWKRLALVREIDIQDIGTDDGG